MFTQDGTLPSEAPDPNNTQPHIIAITHDDYNQYFIAVEKGMYMESTDIATAVFLLLGSHYVFNLSYHVKVFEVLRFLQEKVGGIPSDRKMKFTKSAVASSHSCGIVAVYEQQKMKITMLISRLQILIMLQIVTDFLVTAQQKLVC